MNHTYSLLNLKEWGKYQVKEIPVGNWKTVFMHTHRDPRGVHAGISNNFYRMQDKQYDCCVVLLVSAPLEPTLR